VAPPRLPRGDAFLHRRSEIFRRDRSR